MVTFLFTDVEGSTRRWEADAEGMRKALAAHDEVLRGAIEGYGGWLFKHTGGGTRRRRGGVGHHPRVAVSRRSETDQMYERLRPSSQRRGSGVSNALTPKRRLCSAGQKVRFV